MRIRRNKGYVLIAVLAMIAVLLTIVAVLQYQGMARRRNAVLMEAQYMARLAFESAQAVMEANLEGELPPGMEEVVFLEDEVVSFNAGDDPTGSVDSNSVYIETEVYSRAGSDSGSHIYKGESKRDIGTTEQQIGEVELHGRNRSTHPYSLRVEGKPTSWNPTYDLFKRNRFQATYLGGFPYAAYAPGSGATVEIDKLRTWAMPTIDEYDANEVNPLDLNNGLTPFVGAGGDVIVVDAGQGELYSQAGTISVEEGNAIGFTGRLPYQSLAGTDYFSHLTQSIEKVVDELDSVSTDKSAAVFGKLSLAQTVNWIIKGKTPSNFLSYQSASAWWFFLIPSYVMGPGYIDFKLHVPLPADLGPGWDALGTAPSLVSITNLMDRNKELNKELLPESAPDNEEEWDSSTPGLLPKLAVLADEYNAEAEELDTLEEEYQQLQSSGANDDTLEAKLEQIEAKREVVDRLHEEVEDLDQEVQRKEDTIEHNKEQIEELRSQIEGLASDWLEGDPKGPMQLTETALCWTKIGTAPNNGVVKNTEPKNSKEQKNSKDSGKGDDKYWMSQRGMVYHSYAAFTGRLAVQVVNIIKQALTTFPMKKVKIKIKIPGVKRFKTKLKIVPDISKIPAWLKGVGEEISQGLQNLVVYEVPLLYLGGRPIEKIVGKNFKIYDTFQVPMGRTFKLDGDMTIHGDLWLQKGSSMTVTGDLVMKRPHKQTDAMMLDFHTMMTPRGRIYMEEGTSLVVGGDLEGSGDKFMGSVVACGPMGKNRGITAVILCDGKVELPHGTAGGVGFVELIDWVGDDTDVRDMRRFFEDWAPNLSKVPAWLSPFWWRVPYFGKYPVVLKVIPPVAYPIPTFEIQGQNLNCYIFRIMTNIFGTQMNLTLGENFTTNCLWWGWANEQVAVFPKHAGPSFKPQVKKRYKEWVKGFGWAKGDAEDALNPLLKGALKQVKDVEGLGKSLGITAALALNPDPTNASYLAAEEVMEEITGEQSLERKAFGVMNELNLPLRVPGGIDIDIWKELKNELRDVQNAVNALSPTSGISVSDNQLRESANVLLLECPGVYVYAGESLQVGGEDTARAVGCFVSDGDVTMDVEYTIGAIISGHGNITARQLYHAPQYARASVYIPEKLRKGGKGVGALDDLWDNAMNFKYGSKLDSETSMNIPGKVGYYRAASGWSR